jgi:hypothetical protein
LFIVVDDRGEEEEEAGWVQGGKLHQLGFSDYFPELLLNHSSSPSSRPSWSRRKLLRKESKTPTDEVAFKALSPTALDVSPERRPIRQTEWCENSGSIPLVSRMLATQHHSRTVLCI